MHMKLYELSATRQLSKYKISKLTGIPYSTISDLFNEKTSLYRTSVEVLYKLSLVLNVSMEDLLDKSYEQELIRIDFELFKSNLQHAYKDRKIESFIKEINKNIEWYFSKKWNEEAFYSLAFLDYACRINKKPINNKYDKYRLLKLDEVNYPKSILLISKLKKDKNLLQELFDQSIPEFKKFNIVELDVNQVA